MIEGGKLRHRIALQTVTVTKDSGGILLETWVNAPGASSVPASLEPLKGREYYQAAAVTSENTIPVTIRYRSGITAAMRVLFGVRILNIRHVLNVEERNIKLILLCEEVVNGG